ncbi:hypothetical protein CFP65_4789 [Kitasatospora sp. MMS16-BH015]|uniref:DUF6113 family protein n=1 Tax=Kitasatospora sp. MMS16-BH015 TaxID=2018025 RepID=UPI000CA2CAFE|nr:DUF6113 family protein [Kitasatospora sp. MMS16-BH015]AUG79511.1 hypothetical protein CFP65_4789 [Kitasatospora sp. MMS16-BH015]
MSPWTALLGTRSARLAEAQPSRGARIALYTLFFLLGAAASLAGCFVQSLWTPGGLLLALAGTWAVFYGGLRATGTKLGAGAPLAGWFAVLLVLMSPRPEGDFVLAAGLTSYGYLFLGAVGGVICATLPTRTGYAFGVPGPGR